MVIGVAPKSYKALFPFPLWYLKKKDIEINKIKNHAKERLKALERILRLKQRKR